MGAPVRDDVIAFEQRQVDFAYDCYEARLARLNGRSVAQASVTGKDGIANRQRQEEEARAYGGLGEESLVIGRVDAGAADGGVETWYIGRRPVWDDEHNQVVVNWTSESARRWFDATPESPGEVVLRRRLICSQRIVDDYVDDIAPAAPDTSVPDTEDIVPGAEDTVPGTGSAPRTAPAETADPRSARRGREDEPGADGRPVPTPGDIVAIQRRRPRQPDELLLRELQRSRSGRMRDIVETIRRDQMALVTGEPSEILVVQGGPGTGKSAVGLHRVTWLVNNHHVTARDVLVIGPHQRFLRYVGQVLPTLGTRDVNAVQLDRLWDGEIHGTDGALARRVKSDDRMAAVLRRRVEGEFRPTALDGLLAAPSFEGDEPAFVVTAAGATLRLSRVHLLQALEEVHAGGGSYRERRDRFRSLLVDLLLRELVAVAPRRGRDRTIRRILERNRRVERLVERIWPSPGPAEALRSLYDSPQLLRACADGLLDEAEQRALHRPRAPRADQEPWTLDDRVLLEELRYLITGETPRRYGHIIVDEAQDLTPMQARSLRRRLAAGGSMTVLGDLAQATGPHAYTDWDRLGRLLAGQGEHRVAELTTSYRVPADVMEFAEPLARAVAPTLPRPRTIPRDAGHDAVRVIRTEPEALVRETVARVRELTGTTDGRTPRSVAVVVPDGFRAAEEITRRLAEADGITADEHRAVTVLAASEAKGLEFDHVVVVEPAALAGHEPVGLRLLYIALTRSTQSLTIMHSLPLPAPLTADDGRTEPAASDDGLPAPGTWLRVRVVAETEDTYWAEALDHTVDRPLRVVLPKGGVTPVVGTELRVWVQRHLPDVTDVSTGTFGRLPISATMHARYLDALGVIAELSRGEVTDTTRPNVSELQGMATRCLKCDRPDWLDVWQVLGRPSRSRLQQLRNLASRTNQALKSGTFDPQVFRAELDRSGWAGPLDAARRTLAERGATGGEDTEQTSAAQDPDTRPRPEHVVPSLAGDGAPVDAPEPARTTAQQPRHPRPEEPGSPVAVPDPVPPAAGLAQHLQDAAAVDRTCNTHEAVRLELMAALLRADLKPESTAIVDVSCVTGTGLAVYEVLGDGRTGHADLRAGAARLLEVARTLPEEPQRRYLVLCAPPAEPWSASCVRDVLGVDVVWRTQDGGWEGDEVTAALGAG